VSFSISQSTNRDRPGGFSFVPPQSKSASPASLFPTSASSNSSAHTASDLFLPGSRQESSPADAFTKPGAPASANGSLFPTGPSAPSAGSDLFRPSAQAGKSSSGLFDPPANGSASSAFPTAPASGNGSAGSPFFPPGVELSKPVASSEGQAAGIGQQAQEALTLSSLSAARTAAIAALPPGANAAFMRVWQAVEDSATSKTDLLELLDKGALAPPQGQSSLVEEIDRLTRQSRASGVDGAEVTRQTLAVLSHPDESVYQGASYTCSVTNIERQLADRPKTFVQLVDGLTSPEGKARLADGTVLERLEGSLPEDGSLRTLLDRLIQGSLMSYAGNKGRYDPVKDRFENDEKPGLKPLEIGKATAALENKDQVVIVHDGGTDKAFKQLVRDAAAGGDSFQLGVSWTGGIDHMVLLTKIDGDTAHYFDPAAHQAGTMPFDRLMFKAQFALLDESQLQPEQLPEDAQYWYHRSPESSPAAGQTGATVLEQAGAAS
jgi:hypothetical protein